MATVTSPPVSPSPAVDANGAVPRLASGVSIAVDAQQLQRALIELLLVGSSLAARGSLKLETTTRNSTATISCSGGTRRTLIARRPV